MRKTFRFLGEDRPGAAFRKRFIASWPATKRWYLKEGLEARSSLEACDQAFDRHLPELKPMWQHLCVLAGAGDLESRVLSLWAPPNIFAGCSVAVTDEGGPILVRNYDFDPCLTGSVIIHTNWFGRRVIGVNEGSWGLLDGMNDAGLAVCLTFGGRPICGEAFSVVLVLRYLLETCRTAAEAADRVLRLRTALQQNVVVLDASGAHFTALMGPDRNTRLWQTSVTTNHPESVEWPEHAANVHTVERFAYLCDHLGSPAIEEQFFAPPLYSTGYTKGFGTVYTVSYRPDRGEAVFAWPGKKIQQSFESFSPTEVTIDFVDGEPARVVA
jgi:predicted choloylglycine hydrolase